MTRPLICFGQQPCGFLPKRFLVSKIRTAKRLQAQIGGEMVFFYHDSDHDPRETMTQLPRLNTGVVDKLNFTFINKIQKKYTPLYLKRVDRDWQMNTARQLRNHVPPRILELFTSIEADNVADFCLQMYRSLGLLEGIRVARSSDSALRESAADVEDFYVDVEYEGEIVRARHGGDRFRLHRGGDSFIDIPPTPYTKRQVSPARDTRLRWMQSVIKCTHYVAGTGETQYLNRGDSPEIEFVDRDFIEKPDEAYVGD